MIDKYHPLLLTLYLASAPLSERPVTCKRNHIDLEHDVITQVKFRRIWMQLTKHNSVNILFLTLRKCWFLANSPFHQFFTLNKTHNYTNLVWWRYHSWNRWSLAIFAIFQGRKGGGQFPVEWKSCKIFLEKKCGKKKVSCLDVKKISKKNDWVNMKSHQCKWV